MAPRLAREGDVVPFAGLNHLVQRVCVADKNSFLIVACAPCLAIPHGRPTRGYPPTRLWCAAWRRERPTR